MRDKKQQFRDILKIWEGSRKTVVACVIFGKFLVCKRKMDSGINYILVHVSKGKLLKEDLFDLALFMASFVNVLPEVFSLRYFIKKLF